jgi:hypothetical protein
VANHASLRLPNARKDEPNNAIVAETSQLNGISGGVVFVFPGYVHSPGTEKLGFSSRSVLDPGTIPNEEIDLLNTPVNDPAFNPLNL